MPFDDEDREQLAEDMLHDRRINRPIYCAHCGYNLKTLPKSYHCPECGSLYAARSPAWKGIYTQCESRPPVLEFLGLIIVGTPAVFLVMNAIASPTSGLVTTAVAFAVLTLILAGAAFLRTTRFLHAQRIARHIADQEAEEY